MPAAPESYVYIIACQAQADDGAAVATVTLVDNGSNGIGGILGIGDLAPELLVAARPLLRRRTLRIRAGS